MVLARRRRRIRASLSGICSISSLMPLSPGPICIHCRIRVPLPSGSSENRQRAAGPRCRRRPSRTPARARTRRWSTPSPSCRGPRDGCGRGTARPAPARAVASSHWPPWNSVLNLAGIWMSQTSGQTAAGGAAMRSSASVVGQSAYLSSSVSTIAWYAGGEWPSAYRRLASQQTQVSRYRGSQPEGGRHAGRHRRARRRRAGRRASSARPSGWAPPRSGWPRPGARTPSRRWPTWRPGPSGSPRVRDRAARRPHPGDAGDVGHVAAAAVRRPVPARHRHQRAAGDGGLARRQVRARRWPPPARRSRSSGPSRAASGSAMHGQVYQLPLPGGPGRALRSMLPPASVPIYIAALGPRNLELTGELADGWIGNAFMPEHAEVFLGPAAGRRGQGRAGRFPTWTWSSRSASSSPTTPTRRPGGMPAATRSRSARWARADQNFYNAAFARQGFGDDVRAVQELWLAGRRDEAADRVPLEIGSQTNLLGHARDDRRAAAPLPRRGHQHAAGQAGRRHGRPAGHARAAHRPGGGREAEASRAGASPLAR